MNFDNLINLIDKTHNVLQTNTIKAINRNLTIRNWLIGFYIKEYEQNGEDRAKYGEKLLFKLSENLNLKGISERSLRTFRILYKIYPKFVLFFENILFDNKLEILHLTSAEFKKIRHLPSVEFENVKNIFLTIKPNNGQITESLINSLTKLYENVTKGNIFY